jgi:ATP-dependent DNA helicase RecG
VTQKQIHKAMQSALARAADLPEWIDAAQKSQAAWPDWRSALQMMHAPQGQGDIAPNHPARVRLAYDELFAHQLSLSLARASLRRGKGQISLGTGALQRRVLDSLLYRPTGAQTRAISDIVADMAAPSG